MQFFAMLNNAAGTVDIKPLADVRNSAHSVCTCGKCGTPAPVKPPRCPGCAHCKPAPRAAVHVYNEDRELAKYEAWRRKADQAPTREKRKVAFFIAEEIWASIEDHRRAERMAAAERVRRADWTSRPILGGIGRDSALFGK